MKDVISFLNVCVTKKMDVFYLIVTRKNNAGGVRAQGQ